MSAPFAVIIYYRLSHVRTSDLMKRRPDPMPNTAPDPPSSRHHRIVCCEGYSITYRCYQQISQPHRHGYRF